jgi:hypothetical protein
MWMWRAARSGTLARGATLKKRGYRNMNIMESSEKLLQYVEDGLLNRDTVIMACVKYMSEDEVSEMCRINEFFEDENSEYENDDSRVSQSLEEIEREREGGTG